MEFLDIIKTRKSVRTFDGRQLSDNDKTKLTVFIENTAKFTRFFANVAIKN